MKSIIKSLYPEICERVANGKQTTIMAKSAPKEIPFEGYIYCTQKGITIFGDSRRYVTDTMGILNLEMQRGFEHASKLKKWNGKVIGEFICNKVHKVEPNNEYYSYGYDIDDDSIKEMGITHKDLIDYGKGRTLYVWYIDDLKIYGKLKELDNFSKYGYIPLGGCCQNHSCKNYIYNGYYEPPQCKIDGCFLKQPPSDWQYAKNWTKEYNL